MQLAKFETSIEGLELFIDTQDGGAVYASQRGLARMCQAPESSVRYWLKGVAGNQPKMAKAPTPGGLQGAQLWGEDTIYEALAKYNTDLLVQCAKAGIRVYLHGLAGYQYQVVKPYPVESLPPADVRFKDLVENLKYIGFEVNNPRFNQAIKDLAGDMLGINQNLLDKSYAHKGVVERAEELGYPKAVVLRYRSSLGRYVSQHGESLDVVTESRLCNGTERDIKLYKVCPEFDRLIDEYLKDKVV